MVTQLMAFRWFRVRHSHKPLYQVPRSWVCPLRNPSCATNVQIIDPYSAFRHAASVLSNLISIISKPLTERKADQSAGYLRAFSRLSSLRLWGLARKNHAKAEPTSSLRARKLFNRRYALFKSPI